MTCEFCGNKLKQRNKRFCSVQCNTNFQYKYNRGFIDVYSEEKDVALYSIHFSSRLMLKEKLKDLEKLGCAFCVVKFS